MSDDARKADLERAAAAGERLANAAAAAQGRHKFPEVTGLCRTCSLAHITRRQYSEVPTVICEALISDSHRVHLDITECSSYRKKGQATLDDMTEIALLVDPKRIKAGFAR